MANVASRLRAWVNVFFDELWRLIPAQPILFPFFAGSGVLALLYPSGVGLHWAILSLVSPVLVLVAWYLIVYRTGFCRYMGMWFRTGGDIGQAMAIVVDTMVWAPIMPVPLIAIMVGVTAFVLILVIRDLLALWLVEKVATNLYRDVHYDVAR